MWIGTARRRMQGRGRLLEGNKWMNVEEKCTEKKMGDLSKAEISERMDE